VRSGALDAADDGRGGVEDGVLSCPDVDPSRNQIHHTQCGAGALADDTFHRTYAERIGAEMASKLAFSAWLLACCSGSSHPPGRVWITVARQPPPPHLSIDHPPALDLAFRQPRVGVGPVDAGPTWSRLELSPHLEAGTGGNRRRWPPVNGADDLAAVDALKVDARDGKVGVPKLPLDNNQRNTLVRHLDGVRVPQLMRRDRRLTPASAAA